MSRRKYFTHPLLVAALALGAVSLAPAPAAAHESGSHSAIVAHGTGEVRVKPDSVSVDVGIETQAATLDEARSKVSADMQRVLDALHALPGLTIETREIHFSPVYALPKEGQAPSVVGFTASNHVMVSSKKAPVGQLAGRSAQIVDVALAAGANSVGSIDFFLADPAEAEDQALALAVKDAETDAQVIAKAANVTILGLLSIEEASASHMPRSMMLDASAVGTPIEIGELIIESTVTAKYSFH